MAKKKKPSLVRKLIRAAFALLAAALLVGAFYIAVILGQPQENEAAVQVDMNQPLLSASPAVNINDPALMNLVESSFPVPLMRPVEGSGLTLVSGVSCDVAYEGGFARRVTLTYQTELGKTMTVESIYPARALELMGAGDYHMAGISGQALAGMQSIRMEDGQSIRMHAQSGTGLYVVTVPMVESSELAGMIKSLQLTGTE